MNTFAVPIAVLCLALAAAIPATARADDCWQIARQEAGSQGATVLSAQAVNQGGQTVCIIKLRIPGAGGRPPRVETVRRAG